jgi:predicted DNA-binding WGR domain protein
MSVDVGLIYAGWNTEGTSDKVWGVIKQGAKGIAPRNSKVYVFWGARGKSMMFKADTMTYEIDELIRKKQKKGYKDIDYTKLLMIWPDFEDTLSQRFTFFLLSQ